MHGASSGPEVSVFHVLFLLVKCWMILFSLNDCSYKIIFLAISIFVFVIWFFVATPCLKYDICCVFVVHHVSHPVLFIGKYVCF